MVCLETPFARHGTRLQVKEMVTVIFAGTAKSYMHANFLSRSLFLNWIILRSVKTGVFKLLPAENLRPNKATEADSVPASLYTDEADRCKGTRSGTRS